MLEIDELARRFDAHHTEIKALFGSTEKTLQDVDGHLVDLEKKMNARLSDVEQRMVRRPGNGQSFGGTEAKTIGAALVQHADYPQLAALANTRGKRTIELKSVSLTSSSVSAGPLAAPDFRLDPILLPRRRLFLQDIVGKSSTTSNLVYYPRQTLRNFYPAMVPEGTRKPRSDIAFSIESAPVRTLAHWTKASRQILDDAPNLQGVVDGELRWGLESAEEDQLLWGDGTGVNVLGIIPQATAYETGRNVGGDTKFDTIAHGLNQAEVALLPSSGVVMNIDDLEKLKIIKDSQGRYIGGGPFGPPITSVWGRPVVGTPTMPTGHWLVGAFLDGATMYDRQGVNVLVSTENEDDFVNNMVSILAEERFAFAVRRPQSFIYGAFP